MPSLALAQTGGSSATAERTQTVLDAQESQRRIEMLERELRATQAQLAQSRSATVATVPATGGSALEMMSTPDRLELERSKRRTLVTGAALVLGGMLLGRLLPWVFRGRRRRYGDF